MTTKVKSTTSERSTSDLKPHSRIAPAIESISRSEGFAKAIADWKSSGAITWEGVWQAAVAPLVASVLYAQPQPLLIVVSLPADVDSITRDLEYLLGRSIEVFPQASDDVELESLLQREVVERLQVLSRLESHRTTKDATRSRQAPPIVITTLPALMHSVPSPASIRSSRRLLKVGQKQKIDELRTWFIEAGYHTTTSVQLPGEFTFRGGILDVYPPDSPEPIRIEWFDDEIESIRMFDAMSQKSIDRMETVALPRAKGGEIATSSLLDYLEDNAGILLHEPQAIMHTAQAFLERIPFPERFLSPTAVI